MLTPLLSPFTCASCRLCCNFVRDSVWECPALEPECTALLRSLGVPLVERAEGGETVELEFASEERQKTADCPLLDKSAGCRLPRDVRPLECRLWPLRLMRDVSGEVCVACYNSCPGLAAVSEGELAAFTRTLLPLLEKRAADFPESVRPWHPTYTILFRLNDSPALL